MLSPALEALLILQDRDTKRLGLEAQLKAVPLEIARVEQTIAAEKAATIVKSAKSLFPSGKVRRNANAGHSNAGRAFQNHGSNSRPKRSTHMRSPLYPA